MNLKVSELLKEKSREIIPIGENKRLKDVVEILHKKKVGALIVLDDDKRVMGIISERDILKKLYETEREIKNVRVKRAMTPWEKLIVSTPDDGVDYLMKIMTKNRVRHIPVVNSKCSNLNLYTEFAGLISIGDVVKSLIDNLDQENKMLRDYVKDIYPTKY
jgi:CBS domain-containing protein